MTDPTRAAAVAALWWDGPKSEAERLLVAILANPDHRRALLAVLGEAEIAAQYEAGVYLPEDIIRLLWEDGPRAVAYRLTEPTDTGSVCVNCGAEAHPETPHYFDKPATEPTDTGSGQRHEPDVRAPQWEKQWCVVDNEDWPCAVERQRRRLTEPTDTGSGT